MEYTALLAGESFSDRPRCVDDELAAVLRSANDQLCDDHRAALIPTLGRAIGLVVPAPQPDTPAGASGGRRRARRAQRARHRADTARLRSEVWRLFLAAVGPSDTRPAAGWPRHENGVEIAWLFWDLMDEPTRLTAPEDYVRRLLDRLDLLHACYEQAMDELGIPRPALPDSPPAADGGAPPAEPPDRVLAAAEIAGGPA
jgi:hypothetical protein